MIIIYRACSVGNPDKHRPIEGKYELVKYCFESFLKAFEGLEYRLVVLLDKPTPKFRELFKGYEVEETFYTSFNEGNINSFHRQIDLACDYGGDSFMFVEDDYYFFPYAGEKIIGNDLPFFTPYDHPDHYVNPEFDFERKLVIDNGHHWVDTLSTTLTFGGKTEILCKEAETMKKYGWADHPMWKDITKRWRLYSPIPTLATHMENEWLATNVEYPFLQTS